MTTAATQVNAFKETLEFTMDPNLLVSVIKSQAGTLTKAISEGVMNSIDAGATRVDVTITDNSFIIEDNGRGFASEVEIKNWFGRFGTPHEEGDATYGRFRMGRGQMMAFAATTWESGPFQMVVDIEKSGLNYELQTLSQPVKGCRIVGSLYQPLSPWKLQDTFTELRKAVAYTPKPVYVNGELFGAPADRLKTWTFETDEAYFKLVPNSSEMQVYNQGVFVEDMGVYRTGMGGVIVSKKPLEVNFARNSVLEEKCSLWKTISAILEAAVLAKLTGSKKLEDGERRYVARRLPMLMRNPSVDWREAKVLTDPSGKHLPLSALGSFTRFVYVEDNLPLACAAHGVEGTFVFTGQVFRRFGVSTLEDMVYLLKNLDPFLLNPDYTIIEEAQIVELGLGGAVQVEEGGLANREAAALKTLVWLNSQLSAKLISAGLSSSTRQLLVGKHKSTNFVAWTDGKTYITANKKYFKLFDTGMDGVLEWLQTLVHEYMHDTDDSESHDHGEVFYRKYHDAVFTAACLNMATLAQAGLSYYLLQLSAHGFPKPHSLTRQLKGLDA
jgi:hypothetical protein